MIPTISSLIKKVSTINIILFACLSLYMGCLSIFITVMTINEQNWPMLCPAALMMLLTAPCVFFLVKNILIRQDFRRDGNLGKLVKSGYVTVDEIVWKIDGELEHEIKYSDQRSIFLTTNWLISRSTFSFSVMPISRLVWVYKEITRTNYGAKYFAVIFVFGNRKKIKTMVSEKQVDALIGFIQTNVDNVLVGYDKEKQVAYRSDR